LESVKIQQQQQQIQMAAVAQQFICRRYVLNDSG
jgi:hypothetical protein